MKKIVKSLQGFSIGAFISAVVFGLLFLCIGSDTVVITMVVWGGLNLAVLIFNAVTPD